MKKKHVFPDWVKKFQEEQFPEDRYTIDFHSNHYYVYEKHTFDGKNHVYLGSLTCDGLKRRKKAVEQTIPDLLNAPCEESEDLCYEFGFTKGLIDLCPQKWLDENEDSLLILYMYIIQRSPNSVLTQLFKGGKTRQYPGMTLRLLREMLPVSIDDIYNQLSTVYQINNNGKRHITKMTQEQRDFCRKYNIHLTKGEEK